MNKVFALVDCNNFYASCERLFRPELRDKPIVVLSNNDGCIVARSNEAKALGIAMGAPYFKTRPLLDKHQVQVFSSNYSLYGDLSHRVMTVLREIEPEVESYSIDEAFISLPRSNRHTLTAYAAALKARVEKDVGIPVSIGIAPTKTLAKLANRVAKTAARHKGAFAISDRENWDGVLTSVAVGDIWGMGRRSTEKLQQQGIHTALALKNSDTGWIRKHLTITGLRTVLELRGISCLQLEEVRPARKSIISSRSFGQPLSAMADLKAAVTNHVAIAAEKLRRQKAVASSLQVFIQTNPFRPGAAPYAGNMMMTLPHPSAHTPTLINCALQGLARIYKAGYAYNKAGIMLTELGAAGRIQQNLFRPDNRGEAQLMTAMDRVNGRWGRDTLQFAGAGLNKTWQMRQAHKSPAYTTNWQELPVVSASY